ncbi:MAG: DUF4252 domain-containing protein [Bacteroidota bacterium]
MKNLLLLICLVSISWSAAAQNRSVKNFYHKYKRYEDTRNFVLPGFLVWLSTGIANEITTDQEAKVFLKFAKKFKKMRFLVMEDGNQITADDYNKLIAGAKKENYEELISIKNKGANIQIMGRGKKDRLKNLLVLVSEEDTFVMMNMKTKIRVKDLNRLINDLVELEKVQEKLKKEEETPPTPPVEKKKKKLPSRVIPLP